MSRALPRPAAIAPAALALGLVLSGCGAGFQAQTYQQRPAGDGTNAAVGAMAVRNVQVLPAESGEVQEAGTDIEVGFTLVNDGGEDDRLVEVTSPAASGSQLLQATDSGPDSDVFQDGEPVDAVDIPALSTTGSRFGVRLEGLSEDLRIGQFIEVTFRFERNGVLDVQVPVATTGVYDDDRERSDNFHPPGSEDHGGEG